MAVTRDSRLRYWPWVLGSVTLGLALAVVAPPLVLILLITSGFSRLEKNDGSVEIIFPLRSFRVLP